MSFEEIVYGWTNGLTHGGQQTKCDHESSPCHYVTGVLKICSAEDTESCLRMCFMAQSILFVCLFDLGLTSLSTIFQSYRDSVWM